MDLIAICDCVKGWKWICSLCKAPEVDLITIRDGLEGPEVSLIAICDGFEGPEVDLIVICYGFKGPEVDLVAICESGDYSDRYLRRF